MAQVTGTYNYWNGPNYDGLLWTADVTPGQGTGTPFLTLMGGLNGGNSRIVPDFDFAMVSEFDFPAAAQPAISEQASETAPSAVSPVLSQDRNTVQIYQEAINVTYKKLSTTERRATDIVHSSVGYWAQDGMNNQEDLKDQLIEYNLKKIARDSNWTFLNGVFQLSTATNVAAKSRGVITGMTSSAIAAGGAALSKSLMDQLFLSVADVSGGQSYNNTPIIFCNGFQKQKISEIYGNQPEDWEIGGLNIQTINTDFGRVGVVYDKMVPTDTIALVSLNACRPVFVEYNGQRLTYEDLAKVGAAEKGQLYGQMGIDYASEKLHGKITGLATS
jgi:hypothetical protein